MQESFTRAEIEPHQVAILNKGRFGNATVRLCRIRGADWVVKDFRPKHRLVRLTAGRFFMNREILALQRLQGIPGVPQNAFRVDADAVAYHHLPGLPLHKLAGRPLPPDFFPQLEALVQAMHARGIAHLDLRYRQNLLLLDDGSPGLIDFQSFVALEGLPGRIQQQLRDTDLAGVYKHWSKRAPASLGGERLAFLHRQNRLRRFWILKGYFGLVKKGQRLPAKPGGQTMDCKDPPARLSSGQP